MSNVFMEIALEEARIAESLGEVPVGAVIVKDGTVISKAHNLRESLKDPTAHAEVIAIREASNVLDNWRLNECEMYVTLEPCPMCAGAIFQSRIRKLYIGTFDPVAGACGTSINILQNNAINSFVHINWLYSNECSDIIVNFFKKRRK